MKRGTAFLKKELAGIYTKQEIDSIIFLIFEKIKGYTRIQYLLSKEEQLNDDERFELQRIAMRLKNHEPVQYILGTTEFYGLPFYTVPGVLIPRPETEELVAWIIQENQLPAPTILDIGTGSGCLAISLKKNIQEAQVIACDISPVCLETAKRNAKKNEVLLEIISYDILKGIPDFHFPTLDVIVSNPPYVRESEKGLMERNVLEYEPELALFVKDNDPLLFYDQIADFALQHLKSEGRLYFEINEAFGNECVKMLIDKSFKNVTLKKDIHGKDRMIRAMVAQE